MLMGALLLSQGGARAIIIYLIVYLFMNVGAFLVVIAVYDSEGSFDIPAYEGLYRRNPWLAFAMTVFLLSLIGFPPLAGFMGKLYLFLAVLKRGFLTVAVVAALNSVVAVFYYVRVIRAMVIDPGKESEPLRVAPIAAVLIGVLTVPNILLILVWTRVDRLASHAASILGSYLPY